MKSKCCDKRQIENISFREKNKRRPSIKKNVPVTIYISPFHKLIFLSWFMLNKNFVYDK